MKLGIVGLPNVGKSTLFNAITNAGAESANYPFCTIEPNSGIVAVPDKRLDKLAEIWQTNKKTPAIVEFVDIAGLVKGASQGAGLGNKFLGNIRNTNAIIHVLRCFDNGNITHVDGSIDPVRDKEIIDTELQLKDLETIENRLAKTQKAATSGGDKQAKRAVELLLQYKAALRAMILEEHPEAAADRSLKILEAGQIEEEDFFCHVTHKTWDAILHDIRKAHENDMESAPDTTPADELIKEVRKAMQSTGDRVQEFLEIFCKAFQLKYKRLTDEERTTLKRLFKRSPLIKNSGINFRRRQWK